MPHPHSAIAALLLGAILLLPPGNASANPGKGSEPALPSPQATEILSDAASWFQRGLECNRDGRYAEAATAFAKVIDLTPGDPQAHFNLGTARLLLGQNPAAAASLQEAVRLDPGFVQAYHNLGAVALELPDYPLAIAAYRQLLRLQPENARVRYQLGLALARSGDLVAARAECALLERQDPALAAQLHRQLAD